MIKNLQTLLSRADEIECRKTELSQRREKLRAQKEQIFAEAGEDDAKAFARVGELGSQENLVTVQMEKLDRELAGLSASLLNEANHVRTALERAGIAKREKISARIAAALAPFVPDAKHRAGLVTQTRIYCPEIRAIEKLCTGRNPFDPRHENEAKFARRMLQTAERAIAGCGL